MGVPLPPPSSPPDIGVPPPPSPPPSRLPSPSREGLASRPHLVTPSRPGDCVCADTSALAASELDLAGELGPPNARWTGLAVAPSVTAGAMGLRWRGLPFLRRREGLVCMRGDPVSSARVADKPEPAPAAVGAVVPELPASNAGGVNAASVLRVAHSRAANRRGLSEIPAVTSSGNNCSRALRTTAALSSRTPVAPRCVSRSRRRVKASWPDSSPTLGGGEYVCGMNAGAGRGGACHVRKLLQELG